jgi:hypothetical protein
MAIRNAVTRNRFLAADRQRRLRERRRNGLVSLTVELRISEIKKLRDLGYLKDADIGDPDEQRRALYDFLDRNLGAP